MKGQGGYNPTSDPVIFFRYRGYLFAFFSHAVCLTR